MHTNDYEMLVHEDPSLPVICHHDILDGEINGLVPHWHEAIELLLFTQGEATVYLDGMACPVRPGDLVAVNSSCLHSITGEVMPLEYDCLIADISLCEEAGFVPDRFTFQSLTREETVIHWYRLALQEYIQKQPYFKAAMRAALYSLFIALTRLRKSDLPVRDGVSSGKLEMVKQAIYYIRKEFKAPVSLTTVAEQTGFSRSYLCRTFRGVTGYLMTDFINLTRCIYAQKLLLSGLTASEAATQSGFENLSYFTRIYKKHMGRLPSAEKQASLSPQGVSKMFLHIPD